MASRRAYCARTAHGMRPGPDGRGGNPRHAAGLDGHAVGRCHVTQQCVHRRTLRCRARCSTSRPTCRGSCSCGWCRFRIIDSIAQRNGVQVTPAEAQQGLVTAAAQIEKQTGSAVTPAQFAVFNALPPSLTAISTGATRRPSRSSPWQFTGAKNASSLTTAQQQQFSRTDHRGGRGGRQAPRHQDQSAVRAARRGAAHHQPASRTRCRGPPLSARRSSLRAEQRGGFKGR